DLSACQNESALQQLFRVRTEYPIRLILFVSFSSLAFNCVSCEVLFKSETFPLMAMAVPFDTSNRTFPLTEFSSRQLNCKNFSFRLFFSENAILSGIDLSFISCKFT